MNIKKIISNIFSGYKDNNSNFSQQKDKNNQQNNNKENDKISFIEVLKQELEKNKEENNADTNITNSTRNQWIQDQRINEDDRCDSYPQGRTDIQDTREGLPTQITRSFGNISKTREGTSEEREDRSRAEIEESKTREGTSKEREDTSRAEIEESKIGIERRLTQTLYKVLSNNPQQAISSTRALLEKNKKLYEEVLKEEKQREHEKKNKFKNFSRDA